MSDIRTERVRDERILTGYDVQLGMIVKGLRKAGSKKAADAVARYAGWDGVAPPPAGVLASHRAFGAALAAGVSICAGGDVGVFAHGDNVRELELMVAAGMTPAQAMIAVTSRNAHAFHIADRVGAVRAGLLADLVGLAGDPTRRIDAARAIRFVMKGGQVVRHDQP